MHFPIWCIIFMKKGEDGEVLTEASISFMMDSILFHLKTLHFFSDLIPQGRVHQ